MMMHKDIILQSGKSPISGRVYPKDELEKAVERFDSKTGPTFALFGNTFKDDSLSVQGIDLESVVGEVKKLYLEGDSLVAEVDFVETEAFKSLYPLLTTESDDARVRMSPIMFGKVEDKDGETYVHDILIGALQYTLIEDK